MPVGVCARAIHAEQWWWSCNVYGEPSRGGDRGHGTDLEGYKA